MTTWPHDDQLNSVVGAKFGNLYPSDKCATIGNWRGAKCVTIGHSAKCVTIGMGQRDKGGSKGVGTNHQNLGGCSHQITVSKSVRLDKGEK